MPKGRPSNDKWVKHKIEILNQRNCYIYKRPNSAVWQYYLQMEGEGQIRKSTGIQGDSEDISIGQSDAIEFVTNIFLDSRGKQIVGMKAINTKKLFDLMDDFLAEEKNRIAPYNIAGKITAETFRIKSHHLKLLQKLFKGVNIPLDKIDYKKLYDYPFWRNRTACRKKNPIEITPPKTQQTISAELTTIRTYFVYLVRCGYLPKVPEFARVVRESKSDNRRDYLTIRQYQQSLNVIRAWSNSITATETQTYNRQVLYNSILIMTNSLMRVGTLRNLVWRDLDIAENIPVEEQDRHHIIRIRKEACKVGRSRVVLSPTVVYFNRIRELAGIPKKPKSRFPHIPEEFLDFPILSKKNHLEEKMGDGTWFKSWKEIKDLCKSRFWGQKNITWYSFRHSGISFAINRGVPLLQLSKLSGTGLSNLELVYFHHEQESKETWELINQNRNFYDRLKEEPETLVPYDELLKKVS